MPNQRPLERVLLESWIDRMKIDQRVILAELRHQQRVNMKPCRKSAQKK
jgi:hypothetical protein